MIEMNTVVDEITLTVVSLQLRVCFILAVNIVQFTGAADSAGQIHSKSQRGHNAMEYARNLIRDGFSTV